MPRRRNGEIPLPAGWDVGRDYDGKIYFIDHNNKKTTWIDPRDSYTKPQTFADCVGNELPLGWEESYDQHIGVYYIDHINQITQLEDPRLEWRALQEAMLKDYLVTAQEDLANKKEIFDVKQQRLNLAQDEFSHLNTVLSDLNNSRASLCSSSSSSSTKYDPDLLKADVALAKNRVSRLKREIEQIRVEMKYKQKGVETLEQVDQKLANQNYYTVAEAQAIMTELRNIQKSLSSGEKEKTELMQSLAKLKYDLTRLQPSGSSPDVSTLCIPQEKLSTASQTDLSGELAPIGARLAEMARLRLQYDEARKRVQEIQQQLADLEEKVTPGQTESDKDRLLLIQEKEQLLRELRSITPKSRSHQEMQNIQVEICRLEQDLNNAMEMSNRAIADRLKLHEEKQVVLQQLRDAMRLVTYLESQLKTLSASTLSMSSSSSLGSLSTSSKTSSKGSLSSLSFTDIYGMPQCTNLEPVNMVDLHRRVEKLLQGSGPSARDLSSKGVEYVTLTREELAEHARTRLAGGGQLIPTQQSQPSLSPRSSLSSVSPPVSPYENGPPPSYEQAYLSSVERQIQAAGGATTYFDQAHLEDRLSELQLSQQQVQPQVPVSESMVVSAVSCVAMVTNSVSVTCSKSVTNSKVSSPLIGQRPIPPNIPITDMVEQNNITQGSGLGRARCIYDSGSDVTSNPPLSPISEMVPDDLKAPSSSGTNTRSISAAVSDESVAGDSGVFEASHKRSDDLGFNEETAQVQIKLRYAIADGLLHIGIERARNLAALFIPANCKVCIKAALLPGPQSDIFTCCTRPVDDLRKPTFGENFTFPVPLKRLFMKTLQVNVWCIGTDFTEECLGCAQVSLADFSPETTSVKWYNVLSFRFMQPEEKREKILIPVGTNEECRFPHLPKSLQTKQESDLSLALQARLSHEKQDSEVSIVSQTRTSHDKQESDVGLYRQGTAKEESSDESTIISSQTSTLTRNQGPDALQSSVNLKSEDLEKLEGCLDSEEEEDGDEEEEEEGETEEFNQEEIMEDALEHAEDTAVEGSESVDFSVETADKETNTECIFIPKKGSVRRTEEPSRAIVIKRSQTFSPSAAVNKNHYICRLNRSDSDSSMPLYRRGPFLRNSVERRSLRWKKSPAPSAIKHQRCHHRVPTSRTSIDMELDLQAQQTKLRQLNDELDRLRELKKRLEDAKCRGLSELPDWLTENENFQNLLMKAESGKHGKSIEDRKVDKLLKKTSKEIYKLRKSKAGKGQPDLVSFKEKMAFFTQVNLNVPVLPTCEDSDNEDGHSEYSIHKKEEMVQNTEMKSKEHPTRRNSVTMPAFEKLEANVPVDDHADICTYAVDGELGIQV